MIWREQNDGNQSKQIKRATDRALVAANRDNTKSLQGPLLCM